MAQIPLSENTLASQLIINSIFLKLFMLTSVELGEVTPSQWSHCQSPMSSSESRLSPSSHVPATHVVTAPKRQKWSFSYSAEVSGSAAECSSV